MNGYLFCRQDVINWVSKAWDAVGEEVIRNSFKCCGINSAMDGTDDLLNDRIADALNAADRNAADGTEAIELLFDEEDEDTDDDFEGFVDDD